MNEQDVRELLENSARTPAPQTRIDVLAAVAAAERRARLRALAPAAASMLVVCGLVGGTVFAVTGLDRSPPATDPSPPAASTTTPAASTATTASAVSAPKRFDPLVAFASFGWLPETEKPPERSTSIMADRISLTAADMIPDPANGPYARVTGVFAAFASVYAAGVVPDTDGTFDQDTPEGTKTMRFGPMTEAPSVNGQPAQWVGMPGSKRVILRWRYAPDAWVELHLSEMKSDTREAAHRIASSMRIGGTERLRFPFHVTGMPSAVAPAIVEIDTDERNQLRRATLSLGGQQGSELPMFTITVRSKAEAEANNNSGEPNTTVDGRPARHITGDTEEHTGKHVHYDVLNVFDVDGLQVDVLIHTASAAQTRELWPDGALGVYRDLKVYADPATWTDQPVR
jgi:hypothetical protein